MKDAKAIVTGVPGWLGNRFVNSLLNGLPGVKELASPRNSEIRVLVTDGEDPFVKQLEKDERVKIFKGDLRDKDSLVPLFANAEGSSVFHIAGVVHPKNVAELFAVNTQGTKNILDVAAGSGTRRFIHISSNSPVGVNTEANSVFDEQSPYHPYMNYGRSKMLAEAAVKDFSSRLETVILRPPWFYGPGQPARQLLFFTMIKNGKVPLVGDGSNLRSMAFLDNICQGMLLAEMKEKAKDQIYWIADREPYTMNKIIDTIELVLERDFSFAVAHKRMRLPGLASELAYAADTGLQALGLYHQKIHVLSEMNKSIACTIKKAEAELGYNPKISIEEGMRLSIKDAIDRGMSI